MRKETMETYLMLTGSDETLQKCRLLRHEVLERVSATIARNDYGTAIRFLGVNVIFQDIKLFEPGVRWFRKRKEIDVDVEVSMRWIKTARPAEIKLALLECLINAVGIAKHHMRKDAHFESERLIDDLKVIANELTQNST
jgi:hypothetical protein